MKLITEEISNVKIITESKGLIRNFILKSFLQVSQNRNGDVSYGDSFS